MGSRGLPPRGRCIEHAEDHAFGGVTLRSQVLGQGARMAKVIYTAEAHVTGGRAEGHGESSRRGPRCSAPASPRARRPGRRDEPRAAVRGRVRLLLRERARAPSRAGTSSTSATSRSSSKVSLLPTEERGFKLAVELDVSLPHVDDAEQASRLVAGAHKVCPYSNATRGNIEVKFTANGQPVE